MNPNFFIFSLFIIFLHFSKFSVFSFFHVFPFSIFSFFHFFIFFGLPFFQPETFFPTFEPERVIPKPQTFFPTRPCFFSNPSGFSQPKKTVFFQPERFVSNRSVFFQPQRGKRKRFFQPWSVMRGLGHQDYKGPTTKSQSQSISRWRDVPLGAS